MAYSTDSPRFTREPSYVLLQDDEWIRNYRAANGASPVTLVPFRFLDYEAGIADEYKPKFSTYETLGRHAPHLAYTGGSSRTVKFSALLFDDDEPGDALDIVRFLQGWTLPWRKEEDPALMHPPEVTLRILSSAFFLKRGILKKVSKMATTPLIEPGPLEADTELELMSGSVAIDVEFVSTETVDDNIFSSFLRSGTIDR